MGEDTRAIEGQIEDTRERMGDTVAALSYKADVPGRMKDSVSEKEGRGHRQAHLREGRRHGFGGRCCKRGSGRLQAGDR